MDPGDRRVRRPRRHSAQSRPVRCHMVEFQSRILLSQHLAFLAGCFRVLPGTGALTVRRGAAGHPRKRGEDHRRLASTRGVTRSRSWRSPTVSPALAGRRYAPSRRVRQHRGAAVQVAVLGQVLTMVVIVGGAGILIGPILGAIFFLYVQQKLSSYTRLLGFVLRGDLYLVRAVPARGSGRWVRVPPPAKDRLMALLELDDFDEALRRDRGGSITSRCGSRPGEVRAVIRPNGAGKTSLFHLITGVVKPSDGRRLVSPARMSAEAARARPVPQRHVANVSSSRHCFRKCRRATIRGWRRNRGDAKRWMPLSGKAAVRMTAARMATRHSSGLA